MRALTMDELGFVSGGSVDGPQWGGPRGGAKYERLDATAGEIIIVLAYSNGGAFDPGLFEEICTGAVTAMGAGAGAYLGALAGVPTGMIGGAIVGGAVGYSVGGDIGVGIGIAGGAIAGTAAGSVAGAYAGAVIGGLVGNALSYYACGMS